MRLATIDIGTNTVLLLIIESDSPRQFKIVADIHAIARLGEGVDRTHRISPEAYARFKEIFTKHLQVAKEYHVGQINAFATSAMRDAHNRESIIQQVRETF